jgi:hypothetical protein
LAHCAYPALPKDHVRRAFVAEVGDPDIKRQLLLGAEKTVNETLRQALELQAIFPAARPGKTNVRTLWRGWPSPKRKKRLPTADMLGL